MNYARTLATPALVGC